MLTIVFADSVRGEGDTLVVSTRAGADSVDASAIATDRAALKIIGGDGGDTLRGSRFNDVIDSGKGSDFVTGDLGLDEFFDSSPSATNGADDDGDGRIDEADENEIDTLIENLGARVETAGADVGLYTDKLVIGTCSTPRQRELRDRQERRQRADRRRRPLAGDAILENLKNLFEKAEITGGAGNNSFVVNDLDRTIQVGNTSSR